MDLNRLTIQNNSSTEQMYEALASKTNKCTITKKGVTHIKTKEFNYTWVIKNFEHCYRALGDIIESPQIGAGKKEEFRWVLHLYTNGTDQHYGDYFSLGLSLLSKNWTDSSLVTLSCLNNEGTETLVRKILLGKDLTGRQSLVHRKFVKKDFVFDKGNNLLSNGDLTIICKLLYCDLEVEKNETEKQIIDEIPDNCRLEEFNDFEQLLENEKFSDVTLIVGAKDFRVHKNILSARSRVFAAMFEHEMKEQNDNVVIISDIEAEVIQEMLRFIYVGKVNNIKKFACDLLIAADKYELKGLKTICEEVITNCLSIQNIGVILNIIDKYDTKKLRESTLEFLFHNSNDLAESENLKTVMKTLSSTLLVEVINTLMSRL